MDVRPFNKRMNQTPTTVVGSLRSKHVVPALVILNVERKVELGSGGGRDG
jgi:hypothetical protein